MPSTPNSFDLPELRPEMIAEGDPLLKLLTRIKASPILIGIAYSVIFNLLRLSRMTGDPKWENLSDELVGAFSGTVKRQPTAFTYFLMGYDLSLSNTINASTATGWVPLIISGLTSISLMISWSNPI